MDFLLSRLSLFSWTFKTVILHPSFSSDFCEFGLCSWSQVFKTLISVLALTCKSFSSPLSFLFIYLHWLEFCVFLVVFINLKSCFSSLLGLLFYANLICIMQHGGVFCGFFFLLFLWVTIFICFRTIAAGIPEYGFLINAKKTVVNFPVDDIPGCSKFKQLPDCRLISWCGLLLDMQTLEVYCDYSR